VRLAAADAAEMIMRMMMRRRRLVVRFFMQVEVVAVAVVGGPTRRCERVSSLAKSVASSCLGLLSSLISKPLTNGKKQRPRRWHYYIFNYIKIA